MIELKAQTADLDEKRNDLFLFKGNLELNENKHKKSMISKEEFEKVIKKTERIT